LPAKDLGRVITAIREHNGLRDGAEITLEANPDSVTPEKLAEYISVGFNRISFGAQSFVPHVLATLDRTHNPENVKKAVDAARAAGEFGVAHMLSSICTPGLEGVAQAAPDTQRLFQLYVHGDQAWVDDVAARAVAEGYSAFCLTVDSALYSRRERDLAKRNIRRSVVPGREHQATLSWKDVDRLKANLSIPLALKGIMTAEDAELAVEHGVDMIYVSNHGGRQLDHGLGAMDVLPEIVKAVNDRAQIAIDGGFNRGTDIVKAIAAGADLVGLGRMQCYALAADGIAGVVRMLELLEVEIRICMGLLGVNSFAELNPRYLQSAPALGNSEVLSAFPLLSLEDKSFY
jgi:glycolate oxidase